MIQAQAIVLKLYPNKTQADLMRQFGGATRWVWNHMLAANKERYEAEKKFIFNREMQGMLPALKKQPGLQWLCDAPAASLQRMTHDLDVALKNCFRLDRGFPRFKSYRDNADRFYVTNQQLEVVSNKVKLPKLGMVRFRSGRVPTGKILGSVVRQEGPGWVCAVQFEAEVATPPAATVAAVGIDLGSRALATLNAGLALCEQVEEPKPLRKALKRLRRQQRAVARSKKRSASRARKIAAVGRTHRRITGIRRNYAHQLTRAIVNSAEVICVEDLHVKGMMQGRVARELADVGLGEVLRQLDYKADWGGRTLIEVGRFYPSSKTCSACLAVQKIGSREMWTCDGCGVLHNRDHNAAMNIRRRGIEIAVGQGMPEPTQRWVKAGGGGIVLSQPVAQAAGLAVQVGISGTLPEVRSADFPECCAWSADTRCRAA